MSDSPQVINTLRTKAAELEAYIRKLERAINQAKHDLAHINASILLFEAPPAGTQFPLHFNLGRLFKGRELGQLCRDKLAQGDSSTRELAEYVIEAKGLDVTDKHLRNSVALRVVNAMRMAEKRGKVERVGKLASAIVWKTHETASLPK